MKLCPLFDKLLQETTAMHGLTVAKCNDALPREAIEAAIASLMLCREARDYPTRELYADYIEQLRALLPEGD
jgi:hypothetical protein